MSTQPRKPNNNKDDLNESIEALGKDFDALGSVIEEEVRRAVGSIANVAQDAVNSVADGMRGGFVGFQPAWQQFSAKTKEQVRAAKMQVEKAAKKTKRSPQTLAKKANKQASYAGGMTLVAGILTAVTLAEMFSAPNEWAQMLVVGVVAAWFAWQSVIMWLKSKRLRRLSTYMSVLGDRTYVTVQQIRATLGKSEMVVQNDLRKALASGMLEGANLTPDGTRLFMGETAYKLYLAQQEQQRQSAQTADASQGKTQNAAPQPTAPKGVLAECDAFVTALKERNERIENSQVSAQIDKMIQHTNRIRKWLTKHPHQENRVRRFTSYYLPTIIKLLDTYCDLELHAVPGSVAEQSQKDITEILSTINTAFQTLENGLVQDTAMDVSAEISALQTVMAQEGLTQENDFAQMSPQL